MFYLRMWFVKQKTAYEMRISDWSSDVCSSDLHLTGAERDHVCRLAGHNPPSRGATSEHIRPGLLRVLDRLQDTPAEIVTELGETLRQSPMGIALTGDAGRFVGPHRSLGRSEARPVGKEGVSTCSVWSRRTP